MGWNQFYGHELVFDRFRRALSAKRMANSFLFVGPSGVGKRTFAIKLAQSLLCEKTGKDELEFCDTCNACQQVTANTHPDLEIVNKPQDKQDIPVELLIGDREHRMSEGLCHFIALKPYCGGKKIAIIDDADFLNEEGSNCLLKTLEEPPECSIIILIGTSEMRQLPTIRSRCQTIRFGDLTRDQVKQVLVENYELDDDSSADQLAEVSQGSFDHALKFADADFGEMRSTLFQGLSSLDPGANNFAKRLGEFVESNANDSATKRLRMRHVSEMACEFYRGLMSDLSGQSPAGDSVLLEAIHDAKNRWPGDAETAANCLERCVIGVGEIYSNANQATWIECWLSELGKLSRGA